MKAINGSSNFSSGSEPVGVGLGNFDGLHLGHMALIEKLISESKPEGLKSVVYTFARHTGNIVRKELFTPLLTSIDHKIEILAGTDLDFLCFDEFDEVFSRMEPEAFVRDILCGRLNIKLAVAGFNYRFGYKGAGDAKMLDSLGKKYGFRVIAIPPVMSGGEVISSTLIRKYLQKGDMEKAYMLLGRHFSIRGTVEEGKHAGSERLGFPTVNIYPAEHLAKPEIGVYITETLLEGKLYRGVTSVGSAPTFSNSGRHAVETHLFDFNENIYSKFIEVMFIKKLRNEKKFNSLNELSAGISEDVKAARSYFGI